MGTGMPELATCVVAALKKQADIAVGNIVGSNIFNILCILGFSSMVHPFSAPEIQMTDYVALVVLTVLMLPLLRSGMQLIRSEGAILLSCYALYIYILWPK